MKIYYLIALLCVMVSLKTFSQAAFSTSGNLCQNSALQFTDQSVVSVLSWSWDFDDGTTSTERNPTHAFIDTGSYNVMLTIKSGANFYSANKLIRISALPKVNFFVDSTEVIFSSYARIFHDSSTTYNPVETYSWNFGDGSDQMVSKSPVVYYKYNDNGSYPVSLKVTDQAGCIDSATTMVAISDRFFVPNVFTPNNDNINDDFIVTSNGISLFSIEIFSRWGNLVFRSNGHEQIMWDGRMPDGSLVKPGTYYYVINSENGNIKYEPEKGFITVFY